jgi:hypothetical protein
MKKPENNLWQRIKKLSEKTSRTDLAQNIKYSWFVNREPWFVPTHHST